MCNMLHFQVIVEERDESQEVPCQAPLWIPSPHLQPLHGSTQPCPRVPSSHPLPLLDLASGAQVFFWLTPTPTEKVSSPHSGSQS